MNVTIFHIEVEAPCRLILRLPSMYNLKCTYMQLYIKYTLLEKQSKFPRYNMKCRKKT